MQIDIHRRGHPQGILPVLLDPPKAHLPPSKDVLHDPKHMFYPRANPQLPAILLPLPLLLTSTKRFRTWPGS